MPRKSKIGGLPAEHRDWLYAECEKRGHRDYAELTAAFNDRLKESGLEVTVGVETVRRWTADYREAEEIRLEMIEIANEAVVSGAAYDADFKAAFVQTMLERTYRGLYQQGASGPVDVNRLARFQRVFERNLMIEKAMFGMEPHENWKPSPEAPELRVPVQLRRQAGLDPRPDGPMGPERPEPNRLWKHLPGHSDLRNYAGLQFHEPAPAPAGRKGPEERQSHGGGKPHPGNGPAAVQPPEAGRAEEEVDDGIRYGLLGEDLSIDADQRDEDGFLPVHRMFGWVPVSKEELKGLTIGECESYEGWKAHLYKQFEAEEAALATGPAPEPGPEDSGTDGATPPNPHSPETPPPSEAFMKKLVCGDGDSMVLAGKVAVKPIRPRLRRTFAAWRADPFDPDAVREFRSAVYDAEQMDRRVRGLRAVFDAARDDPDNWKMLMEDYVTRKTREPQEPGVRPPDTPESAMQDARQ